MRREISTDRRHILGTVLFLATFLPFVHLHLTVVSLFNIVGIALSTLLVYSKKTISKWVKFIFLVGIIAIIFSNLGTLKGLDAGIALLSSLAVLKSFEQKTKRDFYIYLLILQLLLIGQLLSIDGLHVILYIAVIVPLLFGAILVLRNQSTSRYRKEKIKDFFKILAASLPIAVMLFIFFPRYQLGSIFYSNNFGAGIVGLSNKLEPGSIESLVKDDTVAFRAKILKGEAGLKDLYWRASVLRLTDGFNWTKKIANIAEYQREKIGKEKLTYEVTYDSKLAPFERHPLYLLTGTTAVEADSGVKVLNYIAETKIALPYTNRPIHYTAVTNNVSYKEILEVDKRNYLQLPVTADTESISKLARELELASDGSPDSKANSITAFFQRNGFTYTLSPGKYSRGSELREFLFSRKRGFCEHYASSTAILLRKMNVLSRIVIGFQGGRYNPVGNYYQVRNQDAHAWVEYWNGQRWKTIDPTFYVAPERINLGASEYYLTRGIDDAASFDAILKESRGSLIGRVRFFIDMIYYDYNTRFLNFDIEAQQKLIRKLGLKKIGRVKAILGVCFGLMAILLTIFAFISRSRVKTHPADRIIKIYEKKLASVGLKRRKTEGLTELQIRVEKKTSNGDKSKTIIECYNKEKYSLQSTSSGLAHLKKLVKSYSPLLNENFDTQK